MYLSLLHGHFSSLDIVFHVYTYYTWHVISCARITVMWMHYYMTLLFHVNVLLIHGYTISLDIMISYICIIATWILYTHISCYTQLYHVLTQLLHGSTGIHVLIVSVFLLHGSLFILHELLLHEYSCIPVTWLFSVIDIDIPVTGHECCWYVMRETKCHMNLSHGRHL